MKPLKAEFYLLLVTLIWGGTFTLTKGALSDCPPLLLTALRFSIALIVSLIFFSKYLKGIDRDILRNGIILGLLFTFGFLLQSVGLKFTSVSKSAFITGITVAFTPFAYYIIERKTITNIQKFGIFIVSIGLWLFTNPHIDNINIGDALTLGSTLFWAFYITYIDVFTRETDSFAITIRLVIIPFMVAVPISFLLFFIFEFQNLNFHISPHLIGALAYNGLIVSIVVTLIHTSVQKYTTPVKASLIFTLEPVFASIIAFLFINDQLSGREIAGAIVIFIGIISSELGTNALELIQNIFSKKRSY
ncbi:MAG: DMT family transporter [Candidatus Kapabacteria bacterium]|nr:DMT family transporter [Candidatus Kapabacteria bacterium]